MKKILQAILCMLVIGGLIFGATSGSITLTGTVSAQVSIEIVEVNLPLDLDTSATDLKLETTAPLTSRTSHALLALFTVFRKYHLI